MQNILKGSQDGSSVIKGLTMKLLIFGKLKMFHQIKNLLIIEVIKMGSIIFSKTIYSLA